MEHTLNLLLTLVYLLLLGPPAAMSGVWCTELTACHRWIMDQARSVSLRSQDMENSSGCMPFQHSSLSHATTWQDPDTLSVLQQQPQNE